MTSLESDLLGAFEVHAPDDIEHVLDAGASAIDPIEGQAPIDALIQGYLRSDRFARCLRVMLGAGATLDSLMTALLLDDETLLTEILSRDAHLKEKRVSFAAAFTSCNEVSPLHVCAEFNSVRCARVLLARGADVNAAAGIDEDGFGGQTPIFHAVNSIRNYCRPMLELLADAGADLEVRVDGLVWGVDAPWETHVVDVTPLSYAQCGLYAQFHRRESDVYENLSLLYRKRHSRELPLRNVPNKYLAT